VTLGVSPIPADIRLYCAPLHGAPDVPSSQYSGVIPEFSNLCSAKFYIPGTRAQELKVWLHRVTPDGQSEYVPAQVKVFFGQEIQEFRVDGARKQCVLPLRNTVKKKSKGDAGEPSRLEVEVQLAAHAP
jgi:hypothetical protein